MTYDELLALAERAEGATLETVTGKEFRVGVYRDCPFFTPESSGFGQRWAQGSGTFRGRVQRERQPPTRPLREGDPQRVVFVALILWGER